MLAQQYSFNDVFPNLKICFRNIQYFTTILYSSSNRFVYIENYNIENWIFSKNWNLICPNLVVREGIFKEEGTRWSGGCKINLGCKKILLQVFSTTSDIQKDY